MAVESPCKLDFSFLLFLRDWNKNYKNCIFVQKYDIKAILKNNFEIKTKFLENQT